VPDLMKVYPEESLQYYVDPWWTIDNTIDLRRGRLLWTFIPHVDQEPMILVPEGRSSPTDHSKANYRIELLQISKPHEHPKLPVAAIPSYSGELRAVYRAKSRPVLIVGTEAIKIPKRLKAGGSAWQYYPVILVAPYYGTDPSGSRGGWSTKFVSRIQKCEYPQYMWDILPCNHNASSILRLDHIQPIGTDQKSYKWTQHCLSSGALKIMNEWLNWIMTGYLSSTGVLNDLRTGLLDMEGKE